ncbi:MAG: FMN-binding protein [Planctomycetota bacterium]
MSLTEKAWYPEVYMFVVTAIFSGVLIGFTALTQERVERNEQIFLQRAVLVAVGAATADTPGSEISRIFEQRINSVEREGLVEYRLTAPDGRTVEAIGVPFDGQGYWDEIRGVLGVEPDRRTVTGIYFYQQNETPGLGGEITTGRWRSQFPGKTLAAGDEPLGIVQAGQEVGDSAVEAVTGATQTSVRLERMLNADLRAWRAAFGGQTP